MAIRTFSVPDISCNHCKNAIEAEVSKVAGVTSVDVDVATRTVRVEGDTPEPAIVEAIDEAGYEVAGTTG
jgi:copper chaperone